MIKTLRIFWAERRKGRNHKPFLHLYDTFSTYLSTGFVDNWKTPLSALGFLLFAQISL